MIDSFFRINFQIFEIYDQEISSKTKPRMFSVMFLPQIKRLFMACDCGHAPSIVLAHACGYYLRAATISFTELHVELLIGVQQIGYFRAIVATL